MHHEIEERLDLERDLEIARARNGLLAFTLATKPDFEINWHHRAICRAVNYLRLRKTPRELLASWGIAGKRLEHMLANPHPVTKLYAGCTRPEAVDKPMTGLQIHVAPRHGKSEIITRRMPAWWLGMHPDTQIIATGYSADIAAAGNRDVQRILDSESYRAIFPDTRLYDSNIRSAARGAYLRNSDIFEIVNHRGVYKNAGVGGPVTGRGAELALCDDPLKNRQDANSPTIRNTLWDWWTSTLYTRLEKNAVRCIINTRWHELDLSGRTMQQAGADPDADQWMVLAFPAILDMPPGPGDPRKEGEALWPGKYNLSKLKQIRASIGSYDFEALYQQRPAPQEGGIVKQGWWQFYDRLPEHLTDWLISVDLAFKGNKGESDYCCFQVWACDKADRYLIDMVMDRMEFTEQLRTFKSLCARYPQVRTKIVEDAANGAALVALLKREIQGIVPVPARGSKESRLEAVAPQIEAGNVWLPQPTAKPWVNDLILQVQYMGSGAHDDAVDAMTHALARLTRNSAEVFRGMGFATGDRSHLVDGVTGRY